MSERARAGVENVYTQTNAHEDLSTYLLVRGASSRERGEQADEVSHAATSWQPPAVARPPTSAITGNLAPRTASMRLEHNAKIGSVVPVVDCCRSISFRSCPLLKTLPSCRMTTTLIALLSSKLVMVSRSSAIICRRPASESVAQNGLRVYGLRKLQSRAEARAAALHRSEDAYACACTHAGVADGACVGLHHESTRVSGTEAVRDLARERVALLLVTQCQRRHASL